MSDGLDYLDRDQLLELGLDPADVDALLASSQLSGNDGRKVIEADRLEEYLQHLREEGNHDPRE